MPQVKHYGVLQFKEGVTPEQIENCFVELHGLVDQIPGLLDMIHGPYASDEGLNDGFTHGFIMTFESPEARDAYLPNPIHERVKDLIISCLERVIIFDFNVE
jgi:Stress responsive A/B Barrel Domain